jgi:hypothetical protein
VIRAGNPDLGAQSTDAQRAGLDGGTSVLNINFALRCLIESQGSRHVPECTAGIVDGWTVS